MIRRRSELAILLVIAAVQFVNILEFMMVMPLAPDFERALGIRPDQLGLVTSAYAVTAAAAGLWGGRILDRFERRSALAVALVGLMAGTALCGFARGLETMLLARLVAGAFGGPATSLAMSIVADLVPESRRGRSLSVVMTAQSIASIAGLPAGLWLAGLGGWRAPFFVVAALGAALALATRVLLPEFRGHLDRPPSARPALWRQPLVRASWLMTAVVMAGGFALIPFVPSYVTANLGQPRSALQTMYLAGGLTTFVALRVWGRAVDRFGGTLIGAVASVGMAALTWAVFGAELRPVPLVAFYVLWSLTLSSRNVAHQTLASRVPAPEERGRFQSVQSAVQHMASALGAAAGGALARTAPDGLSLTGMPRVAALVVALSLALPFLLWRVERGLATRAEFDAGASKRTIGA